MRDTERFSLFQELDQDSFADKKTVCEGDERVDAASLKKVGVGIACKKGFKPEAPNQDSFCYIHQEEEY